MSVIQVNVKDKLVQFLDGMKEAPLEREKKKRGTKYAWKGPMAG